VRARWSLTRVVLAAALAFPAAVTGCSPLASVPPPKRPLVSLDQCSTSRWPVLGDAYWAVTAGSMALLFLGVAAAEDAQNQSAVVPSWDTHPLTVSKGLLVGGMLSIAATVALIKSAQYGLDSARACDAAQAELFGRMQPGQWPPGSSFNGIPLTPQGMPAPEPPPGPWPSR
jgi:hypothetical protein